MKTTILNDFNDAITSFSYFSLANKQYINYLDNNVGFKYHTLGVDNISLIDSKLPNINQSYRVNFEKSITLEYCLPKAKEFNNWITLINTVSSTLITNFDDWKTVTIKSEGQKIMGSYEPLVCDIPFYTLRLSYIDHTTGWIIT